MRPTLLLALPLPLALSGCPLLVEYPYQEDRPLVEIAFENPEPTTLDDLTARVVLNDERLDIEVVDLRWYLDREVEELRGQLIVPADRTNGRDLWTLRAWVAGIDAEPREVQGSIELLNTPPELTSVSLGPAAPTVLDPLEVVVEATDLDTRDPMTRDIALSVDGAEVQRGEGLTLPAGTARKGQRVTAAVSVTDGAATTEVLTTEAVIIQNLAPTRPVAALLPEQPVQTDDLTCAVAEQATDADGDTLEVTVSWTRDGTPWDGPTTTETLPGDTVSAEHTALTDDEAWSCTVTASDGEASVASEPAARTVVRLLPFESPTLGTLQPVPRGTFTMGCLEERDLHAGRRDCESTFNGDADTPAHAVTLTRSYWVMEGEVTQWQWQTLMPGRPGQSEWGCLGSGCPLQSITWYEALGFANAASEADGLEACYELVGCTGTQGTGMDGCSSRPCAGGFACEEVRLAGDDPTDCDGYRLPTEAEWDRAARGGEDHAFAGSDDPVAVATPRYWGSMRRPCQWARNAYELCDMSGNVWEWTWDPFAVYPESADPRVDPVATGAVPERVLRGAGYGTSPLPGVSSRRGIDGADKDSRYGFRLVRTMP